MPDDLIIKNVIGGGQVVLDHGPHTGALPGRVLRAGRARTAVPASSRA